MKGILTGLIGVLFATALWAETDPTALKTRDQLKEQERTRTELRLQEQTRLKIQEGDFEKLMLQTRTRTRTEAEYRENIEFMLAYALRNRVQSADELNLAGEFYQQNKSAVTGTPRERRLALMTQAEMQIRNRLKNEAAVKNRLHEKNQVRNTARYQSGIRTKNISKNQVQADAIRKKRQETQPRR